MRTGKTSNHPTTHKPQPNTATRSRCCSTHDNHPATYYSTASTAILPRFRVDRDHSRKKNKPTLNEEKSPRRSAAPRPSTVFGQACIADRKRLFPKQCEHTMTGAEDIGRIYRTQDIITCENVRVRVVAARV